MVTTISQRSGRAAHPKDPEEDQEDHEQTGLGGGAENPGTLQVFRGQRQIKFMSIQKRKKKTIEWEILTLLCLSIRVCHGCHVGLLLYNIVYKIQNMYILDILYIYIYIMYLYI